MTRIFKELKISSSKESLTKVENFVEEICEAYYITNSYYGNILVAILEAVKNAIIHGNNNNPDKPVRISLRAFKTDYVSGLWIKARDLISEMFKIPLKQKIVWRKMLEKVFF